MQSDDHDDAEQVRVHARKRSRTRRAGRAASRRRSWTTYQVVGVLVAGIGVGFLGGYRTFGRAPPSPAGSNVAPVSESSAVAVAAASVPAPAADKDKFGRSPGDPHFGHDHASQPGAAAATAPASSAGGPDSFGRAPGSEHYGHNHP